MSTAKATLNNYRQSPRKVRLVADFMRGKNAQDALDSLRFLDKRAALPMRKLLESALANAKDLSIDADALVVKEITVNQGATLYRRRPTARGRALPIRKKTSKVTLVLAEGGKRGAKKPAAKPEQDAKALPEAAEKPKKARAPRKAAAKTTK